MKITSIETLPRTSYALSALVAGRRLSQLQNQLDDRITNPLRLVDVLYQADLVMRLAPRRSLATRRIER